MEFNLKISTHHRKNLPDEGILGAVKFTSVVELA